MSLSIIEITAVPRYSLLGNDVGSAKRTIAAGFCDLLSSISLSVHNCAEQLALELVFHKSSGCLPRLFLTLRGEEQIPDEQIQQIKAEILSHLASFHFSAQEITGRALLQVIGSLRNLQSGSMAAIFKAEKVVPSAFSYSGYYYYTDILTSNADTAAVLSNHNNLLNQFLLCDKAMVSFQLIPTTLFDAESYALTDLSTQLTTITQGLYLRNQTIREVTAEAPRKTYTYYAERAAKPVFIGQILVASEQKNLNGLVAAIHAGIQQVSAEPINLTCAELQNTTQIWQDYFHLPWTVYQQLLFEARNLSIWNGTAYQPTNLIRLPFLYTADEASAFFKLPVDDGIVQGLHSNIASNDNEVISDIVRSPSNIRLGTLRNTQSAIGVPPTDFTRHVLIVGAPGSGKTTFALNLLLQFQQRGIPFLVIEPTKTEYRALLNKIPDLQVFTPGNSSIVPLVINPFIPPKGIRVEQYIPSLMSAFRAAFSMESPLDVIFLRAIRLCYAQYGWKNSSTCEDINTQPFGMFEFISVFKKIVNESGYKSETKANIETGGTFRLLNLLDQNKYIFDTVHTIPIEDLLSKPTVIELNAIADDEQKALIMALLLIGICLYTKNKGSSPDTIHHVLLIDEAHVLLDTQSSPSEGQAKAQGTTVKSLQRMIAEIRSYGTGVIIADQLPSKVTSDVVANTDLKVSFRLVEQNERNILANSTSMGEQQYQHLAQLKTGEALVYFSRLDAPKLITTPDVMKTENIPYHVSDQEVGERVPFWKSRSQLLVPYYECSLCPQCSSCGHCDIDVREQADYHASRLAATFGARIKESETLLKYMYRLHELILKEEAQQASPYPLKKVCNCSKIQFLRQVLLAGSFTLSRSEITSILNHTLLKESDSNG